MKAYITTSRKPSVRTRVFAKDISFLFNANYYTRGKSSISDLVSNARYNAVSLVCIITEKDGNPKQLLLMEVDDKNWSWKEAYFIKILKTRNEFTKSNLRIYSFKNQSTNTVLYGLLKTFGFVEDEDSEFCLKDSKKGVSIFKGDKEIGPSFELSYAKNLEESE